MASQDSIFLRIPAEIRLLVYAYLLDDGGKGSIAIRNKSRWKCEKEEKRKQDEQRTKKPQRSVYHIVERSFSRLAFETTYCMENECSMYPAILCANRKIREEASHYLYGTHTFHFGGDLEAVVPFLDDRTPSTLGLIRNITLYKRNPFNPFDNDMDDWTVICRFIKSLNRLEKLTVVLEGGRPRRPWRGPRQLSVSDLRLLYETHHESLEWVRELATVGTIGEVEIIPHMNHMREPRTHLMMVFAALSASMETSLIDFLCHDLGIPARLGGNSRGGDSEQRKIGTNTDCVTT